MTAPYEPEVYELCPDPECCPDGAPRVRCRVCGHSWPCEEYRAAHTVAQTKAQARWVVRVKYRQEFPDLIQHFYRERGIEP